MGFAALAAVAAAAIIVVLWPDGGVLEVQDSDGAPSMAAHERKAVSDATASPVEAERPLHEDPTHDAVLEHSAEVDATTSVVEPDLSRPISSRSHERRPRSGEAQDSLAEETRLLRQARAALGQGEPRRALAVLSEYERAHPSGLLAEEADAVRTIAKCRMQSTAGRELARSFSARHRSSLFRGQVQAACVLEEDEGM